MPIMTYMEGGASQALHGKWEAEVTCPFMRILYRGCSMMQVLKRRQPQGFCLCASLFSLYGRHAQSLI